MLINGFKNLFFVNLEMFISFTVVLEHVRIIQAGSEMMKVKGSKQYHRTFWLDEELTSVLWNSANKKPFKARSKLL